MPHHRLAALACVPVLFAMAWLVHVEGRSYREALRARRPDDLTRRLIEPEEPRTVVAKSLPGGQPAGDSGVPPTPVSALKPDDASGTLLPQPRNELSKPQP